MRNGKRLAILGSAVAIAAGGAALDAPDLPLDPVEARHERPLVGDVPVVLRDAHANEHTPKGYPRQA